MSVELLLCVSQEEIHTPYSFKLGVRVFSLEEAIYYVYHNWKETYNDFTSDEFLEWVSNALGQIDLSSQIKLLKDTTTLSSKLIKFLSMVDYFDSSQLSHLESEISNWESQSEWERLKAHADDLLIKQNNPQLAYLQYKEALNYEENAVLYNNIGIALMKLEMYDDAVNSFNKASDMDDNIQIIINLAEALIYNEDFKQASTYLSQAEKYDNNNDTIYYLQAKICIEQNKFAEAINYLNEAVALQEDNSYFYKLSEVYIKMRKYQDALNVLNRVSEKDVEFYISKGAVYASYSDYPAATRCIQEGIYTMKKGQASDIWVKLAMYRRLSQEVDKAEFAINEALKRDPKNKLALLEQAKIKKAQNSTKDYQKSLNLILNEFKVKYRSKD